MGQTRFYRVVFKKKKKKKCYHSIFSGDIDLEKVTEVQSMKDIIT